MGPEAAAVETRVRSFHDAGNLEGLTIDQQRPRGR